MLVQLGPRSASEDVVDLLLECHGRIRRFLSFAMRVTADIAHTTDARTVAGEVHRYFTVAFPLHLADEDELVAPALAAAGPEVASALETMRDDHVRHEPAVSALVAACAAVERDAAPVAEAARAVSDLLGPHLELEERVVFPALRALPAPDRDAIRRAMRERRESLP